MRLEKVILENYRGFRMATTINIESDITAILGKNDAGKSSILDALNVFFNGGIEKDDACVTGDSSNVKISCVFSDLPETIIIDTTNNTQLTQEYLLNADGFLEIEKLYDCTLAKPKEKGIFAVAMHPATENHTCPSMLGFVKSFCGISDFFLKILPFQSKFPLPHALMSCKAIYF